MNAPAWAWCGARRLPIARADRFEPPAAAAPLADLDLAVRAALAAPVGAARLRELARGARSVVVTIPDASRPCPSEPVLLALLDELAAAGVRDDAVAVAIGCGLHATTGEAERARLAGPQVVRRVEVFDAQGIETETADLGETSLGAPARIARRVAEADLVVTAGVVEPHLYAGFSGGVKGVAIGCAGRETIAWTHRPAFISRPGVRVARLRENPFQATLREVAARTPLGWGVNLVMEEGDAVAVRAGDPASVQEALARDAAPGWLRTTAEQYDVVVAGVHAPKSDGLYQASRAATYLGLAARPALADGGLLVLCADLPLGAGDGPGERNFLEVLAAAASPAELLERGLREPLGPGGQRAYVVARVLERHRLAVVGADDARFLEPLAHLGVAAFASVDAALAAEDERLARRASVLVVADAMTTLVTAG
ncbi:MAG TPA: lactate racemase domain-containing protein [Thermoleophilia bacterium]|nr:lactate racemase domain-containing protein [Thermoleophilia bacterium]